MRGGRRPGARLVWILQSLQVAVFKKVCKSLSSNRELRCAPTDRRQYRLDIRYRPGRKSIWKITLQELPAPQKGIAMAKVVCLCVDGYAEKERIRSAVIDAFGYHGIVLEPGQMIYSESKHVKISEYRTKVLKLLGNNGDNPSKPAILLVGKSLGGAKIYRFMYNYYKALLNQFSGVATVLVDAHEPIVPGDKGKTGEWYDFVYFEGGKYRLRWWDSEWGPHNQQSAPDAKMRFYVTYQRNEWPCGYSMNAPYMVNNLTHKNVQKAGQTQSSLATHWNIAGCTHTVDLLHDAIGFLNAL